MNEAFENHEYWSSPVNANEPAVAQEPVKYAKYFALADSEGKFIKKNYYSGQLEIYEEKYQVPASHKATLCMEVFVTKTPPAVAQEPVPWVDIVSAIKAVTAEASRRGKMFPQNASEHADDRAASRRVCELIEWYATCGGSVAERLEGWPRRYTASPAVAVNEPWYSLLCNLVDGLNRTNWSSWQTTAHFQQQLSEAEAAIAAAEAAKGGA